MLFDDRIYLKIIYQKRKHKLFDLCKFLNFYLSDITPKTGNIIKSAKYPNDPINVNFHSFSSHVKLNWNFVNSSILHFWNSILMMINNIHKTHLPNSLHLFLYTNSVHTSCFDWSNTLVAEQLWNGIILLSQTISST